KVVLHPLGVERVIRAGSGGEAKWRARGEMTLLVQHWIAGGAFVVIARQQDGGAQVDRPATEFAEHGTLKFEVLDPFGIGWRRYWLDHAVADELDVIAGNRIEVQFLSRAVEIAGRSRPVLPFPLIVVQPNH